MSWKPWMLTWWHYRRGIYLPKSNMTMENHPPFENRAYENGDLWCTIHFNRKNNSSTSACMQVTDSKMDFCSVSFSFFFFPVSFFNSLICDLQNPCKQGVYLPSVTVIMGVFGSPSSWLLLAMDVWLGLEQFEPPWSQFCLCQEAALPPTLEKEGGRHGFLRVPRESQVPLCSVFVVSPSGLQRKRPRLQGFYWEEVLECAQSLVFQHGRLVGS